MSAWVKQRSEQIEKYGAERAPWYVIWNEPNGTRRKKSCGTGRTGKRDAKRLAERIKAELLTGTYDRQAHKKWDEFRSEHDSRILQGMKPRSADQTRYSLNHFERLCKPRYVGQITTATMDKFIAARREQRGIKRGSKVSPATINRDLGNLRAVFRIAVEWNYLAAVPRIRFEKEPRKLPAYVTQPDFAAMYESCDVATRPVGLPYPASDWWRGLLVTAQMTGWRIGELLALRWVDVDLDAAVAVTRHADNKGNRDEKVPLHAVVVDHIRTLQSFDERVFPWELSRRPLYDEFARIQDAAGIYLPCPDAGDLHHGECTPACHRYGFHDERRAFATLNAEHMTREALQALMRHRDPNTTDLYINYAKQLNPTVAKLYVPEILRAATVG